MDRASFWRGLPPDMRVCVVTCVVTSEYGWAVSEKRIKRLLKEDVMAAQLLELAASPSRPEEPPGREENDQLDPKAGAVEAQEQGGAE